VYFDKFSKDLVQDFAECVAHKFANELEIRLFPKKHSWVQGFKGNSSKFKSIWGGFSYIILLHLEDFFFRFKAVESNYDWRILEQIDFVLLENLLAISKIDIYLGVEEKLENITKRETLTLAIETCFKDEVSSLSWAGLEVVHESPSTFVSVSMQNSNLELLQRLSGRYPTMHSVVKNIKFMRTIALQMSLELLKNCAEIIDKELLQKEESVNFLSEDYPQLSVSKVFRYSFRQFTQVALDVMAHTRKAKVVPEWQIAYAFCPWDKLADTEIHIVPNPAGRSLADPFVVTWDEQTVIFVEDIDLKTHQGSISVLEQVENRNCEITKCFGEEFHLSFPFIFEFEEELYMCPESSRSGGIRIYRCTQFPYKWEFVKEIVSGVAAVDTMIFHLENRWWMLTGVSNSGSLGRMSELHCFYSDSPLSSSWVAHTPEILIRNSSFGRNGGLILDDKGVIRVRQSYGFKQYGSGLSLARVENLSKSEYSEAEILRLQLKGETELLGVHHLSSNGKVTAIDFLAANDARAAKTLNELGILTVFPNVAT
jgi:hypothetical protein